MFGRGLIVTVIGQSKMNTNHNLSNRSWTRYICHQRPERCFSISGKPMSICSRCLGFYLGLVVGLFLPIVIAKIMLIDGNTLLLIMLISLIPMALDGLTQLLGLRHSNNTLRFITGFLAGVVLGLIFTWLLIKILFS